MNFTEITAKDLITDRVAFKFFNKSNSDNSTEKLTKANKIRYNKFMKRVDKLLKEFK